MLNKLKNWLRRISPKKVGITDKYRPILEFKDKILNVNIPFSHEENDPNYRILVYKIDLTFLGGELEIEPDPIKIYLNKNTDEIEKVCTRYHWDFFGKQCLEKILLKMSGTHPIVYIPNKFWDNLLHGLKPKKKSDSEILSELYRLGLIK